MNEAVNERQVQRNFSRSDLVSLKDIMLKPISVNERGNKVESYLMLSDDVES